MTALMTGAQKVRWLALVCASTPAFAASAGPAGASCDANATGTANSEGVAASAATQACPPAYGEPTSHDTGRKVV
jgi:hypothetical protein